MTDRICPVCQSDIQPGAQVCPACHFNLAGATQRFKPLAADDGAGEQADEAPGEASLRMVRGPQIGAVYPLKDGKVIIGRNPQCDIFLNDMTVSREHAEIVEQAGARIIADLRSFNGVWVNNATVARHALVTGDYIQIGKYDFIYEESSEDEGGVR